jgi:hypothetical protein
MRLDQLTEARRRVSGLTLVGTIVLVAGACSDTRTAPCTGLPSRAIVVAVRDSVTGAAAADGSFGTVEAAGKVDTLTQSDSLLMFGGDRLGTYAVSIEHAGYATWTASNVNVTQLGSCANVLPVQLTAKLQPSMP